MSWRVDNGPLAFKYNTVGSEQSADAARDRLALNNHSIGRLHRHNGCCRSFALHKPQADTSVTEKDTVLINKSNTLFKAAKEELDPSILFLMLF